MDHYCALAKFPNTRYSTIRINILREHMVLPTLGSRRAGGSRSEGLGSRFTEYMRDCGIWGVRAEAVY
jgi:hypothetical protein